MKFLSKYCDDIMYYYIDSFLDTGIVRHMFTTKIGYTRYSSLNMVCKVLDTSIDNIVFSKQVHDTNIVIIDNIKDIKKDILQQSADGFLTNKSDVTLATFHADCVPLFFLDKKKKVIGLAHAGWKGTSKNIAGKMIKLMKSKFNCNVVDILVGIGPSIGPCCYEVGSDVYNEFNQNYKFVEDIFISNRNGKYFLDLWIANKFMLNEVGIPDENIIISKLCTSCNVDKFFSYRKENKIKDRMIAAIQLK